MAIFVDTIGNNYNGGPLLHDEIYLLDGDDTVVSTDGGNPYVYGGRGHDSLTYTGLGSSNLYGGDGADTLIGGANTDWLFGDDDNDELYGNDSQDILYGAQGNDLLEGGGHDDFLYGGEGNDTLSGGSGGDRMSGDDGNDVYEVNDAGDRVLEHANDGYDTVLSFVGWKLDANFEDLQLFGSAVVGLGNELDNGIYGSDIANSLFGGGGRDGIHGGSGNDSIGGNDGKDTLTGGSGKDVFYFDHSGSANVDKITDFSHADDTIWLDRDLFVNINGGTGQKALKADQFRAHASGMAADKEDRILYDTTDGKLYFDRDGTGSEYSRVHFATINGHPTNVAANDFMIV